LENMDAVDGMKQKFIPKTWYRNERSVMLREDDDITSPEIIIIK